MISGVDPLVEMCRVIDLGAQVVNALWHRRFSRLQRSKLVLESAVLLLWIGLCGRKRWKSFEELADLGAETRIPDKAHFEGFLGVDQLLFQDDLCISESELAARRPHDVRVRFCRQLGHLWNLLGT
jgi:hypothetical protein